MVKKAELYVTSGMAVMSVLALVFLNDLIAKQKMVFGQPSIEPDLFPALTISCLLLLISGLMVKIIFFAETEVVDDQDDEEAEDQSYYRIGSYFAAMLAYGIVLDDLGFVISSCILVAFISFLLGSRSFVQTVALAVIAPVALYVVSTRGLKVHLPELDVIERAIQTVFQVLGLS